MNIEMLHRVATALERGLVPWLGFNMNVFMVTGLDGDEDTSGRGCGTVACIAGWTVALADGMDPPLDPPARQFGRAREILQLTILQADELFFASHAGIDLCDITPAQAARVIRHLAATGLVRWGEKDE